MREGRVSIWEHEKSSYHFPLDLICIGSHLHCALSLPSIRLAIHFHPRLQRLSAFFKLTHNCLFSSRKDDVLWFYWNNEREASEGRAVRQWMRWWWRWWVSRSELKALKWFVYVYLFSTLNIYSFSHIICYESLVLSRTDRFTHNEFLSCSLTSKKNIYTIAQHKKIWDVHRTSPIPCWLPSLASENPKQLQSHIIFRLSNENISFKDLKYSSLIITQNYCSLNYVSISFQHSRKKMSSFSAWESPAFGGPE